jgi:L-asparagine transporter-like permease
MEYQNKILDRFTLGHFIFGLNLGSILLFINEINLIYGFMDSSIFYRFIPLYAIFLLILWEILEHSIVKTRIYEKSKRLRKWKESKLNVVSDIFFGLLGFFLIFLIYTPNNLPLATVILFITLSLISIGIWHQKKKRMRSSAKYQKV